MKKSGFKKLHLAKEAIRTLQGFQLPRVAGGMTYADTLKDCTTTVSDFTCPGTDGCLPGTR